MILSVQHITKSFGETLILSDVSFHLEDHEKAAVVGINGAGKSTLLKIIVGELDPDEGTVALTKGRSIGYLAQYQEAFAERTVYEEVLEAKRDLLDMEEEIRSMEAEMQALSGSEMERLLDRYHALLDEFKARDGYSISSEVSGVLKGLGFTEADFTRRCEELSGGQKTRVALARLLVTRPDLLLLDEPTNHLDMASIRWLENFLLNYKGAVLIVAHDRYFLDRTVTKVIEIRLTKAKVYNGNYSAYAAQAAKDREAQSRAYFNRQREIKHQEEVIEKLRSFNREKSIKRAESREKLLEKMDRPVRPESENAKMRITFTPSVTSGKDVLSVTDLAKSFGEKHLFDGLSFTIRRGEHVALIGENGTGKTTILKVINQVIDADDGMLRLGTNVVIGYYDQEQQDLNNELTLYDEIAGMRPDLTQTEIRNILAAFLFTGEDVFRLVGDLSGGERGRLSLAKMMLSEANFLILDEPTNHLDMESREILESALNSYEGTVLFVSHDRYFINRTAAHVLELDQGRLNDYPGNYDYYLEKKEAADKKGMLTKNDTAHADTDSSVKSDWIKSKEEQANERKIKNRIHRIEEEIAQLEEECADYETAVCDPQIATDAVRLNELHEKQTKNLEKLDLLYAEWETLSESL